MSVTLLTRGDLVIDEATQQAAATALAKTGDEAVRSIEFRTETGRAVSIDPALADLILQLVARVALGRQVSIVTLLERLTTSAAAGRLGVSRTTVMKLIASGALPSTKTGTHHRVCRADVVALKEARESRRAALLEELLLLEDD